MYLLDFSYKNGIINSRNPTEVSSMPNLALVAILTFAIGVPLGILPTILFYRFFHNKRFKDDDFRTRQPDSEDEEGFPGLW